MKVTGSAKPQLKCACRSLIIHVIKTEDSWTFSSLRRCYRLRRRLSKYLVILTELMKQTNKQFPVYVQSHPWTLYVSPTEWGTTFVPSALFSVHLSLHTTDPKPDGQSLMSCGAVGERERERGRRQGCWGEVVSPFIETWMSRCFQHAVKPLKVRHTKLGSYGTSCVH